MKSGFSSGSMRTQWTTSVADTRKAASCWYCSAKKDLSAMSVVPVSVDLHERTLEGGAGGIEHELPGPAAKDDLRRIHLDGAPAALEGDLGSVDLDGAIPDVDERGSLDGDGGRPLDRHVRLAFHPDADAHPLDEDTDRLALHVDALLARDAGRAGRGDRAVVAPGHRDDAVPGLHGEGGVALDGDGAGAARDGQRVVAGLDDGGAIVLDQVGLIVLDRGVHVVLAVHRDLLLARRVVHRE